MRAITALLLSALSSASAVAQTPGTTVPTTDDALVSTSFEEFAPGPLTEHSIAGVRWTAAPGHARISDRHARTGAQCLHLLGSQLNGTESQVTLALPARGREASTLSFWAERWTRRAPFHFHIDTRVDGNWQRLWEDAATVLVGRSFLSRVHVTLPACDALRFVVTAPPDTGVLIDDLRIAESAPMRLRDVTWMSAATPVLLGERDDPLLRIDLSTSGDQAPLHLRSIDLDTAGTTDPRDLASVSVYASTVGTTTFTANAAGVSLLATGTPAGRSIRLSFDHALSSGENRLWVTGRLRDGVDIDRVVAAACTRVEFADGTVREPRATAAARPSRIGIGLRDGGDAGAGAYRIPGLVTTRRGTLIAVYDIRWNGWKDLPAPIDVGASRSTDGGRTWEPMRTILDMGDDGVGDPAILVDERTGRIWVAATWSHGDRAWRGSGPGLQPTQTAQLVLTSSDDDGVTWAEPTNITRQIKDPAWRLAMQAPGRGITMHDGTLVFPAQFKNAHDVPHSTILYSIDRGVSWQIGTGAKPDTTENAVVEIEPGRLMLNMRDNRGGARSIYTTEDLGRTWTVHPTSRRALPEPVCMASSITGARGSQRFVLFSNPAVARAPRRALTIKASLDGGASWPSDRALLLDAGRSAGYSCLTMIDNETVGILYEGSRAHLTFQRVPLHALIGAPPAGSRPVAPHLRLGTPFRDHMVLQRDRPVHVWGSANGRRVTVTLGGAVRSVDVEGQAWNAVFPALSATEEAIALTAETDHGARVSIADVVVGEVWLCAGQSNMAFPLLRAAEAEAALDTADRPPLRLFDFAGAPGGNAGAYTPEQIERLRPADFARGSWKRADRASAAPFSAVAWFFATQLSTSLGVPIGLIHVAHGGSPTEAWIRRSRLAADEDLRAFVEGDWLHNEVINAWCRGRARDNFALALRAGHKVPGDDLGWNHCFKPAFLFEAKVRPLLPLSIAGVLWYQGESNAQAPADVLRHRHLLPALIADWRDAFAVDLPFGCVQLPALSREHWPAFRETQRRALLAIERADLIVSIDTGHRSDVHPRDKRAIGQRLARWALAEVYGVDQPWSGPVFAGLRRNGSRAIVSFTGHAGGLVDRDGGSLGGFEIAAADGPFVAATARIDGATVVLSHPDVASPERVRYAWQPYPDPPVELFDGAGLPAAPFAADLADER